MQLNAIILWAALVGAAACVSGVTHPAAFTDEELKPENIERAAAVRTEAWDARIKDYKADYADSSQCLLPPEDHRLDAPFAVVKGGRPAAEIVLSSEGSAEPCLQTAAEELQRWIKDLTGVELKIQNGWNYGNRETGKNKILLGKRCLPVKGGMGWTVGKYKEALRALSGNDGYAVMPDDDDPTKLYVFAARDKGTLNGVYALLENNTDIIWARPNKTYGAVYTVNTNALDFVWGKDVISVPGTRGRGWNGYADVEWMARNRCNIYNCGGGGDISWMNAKKTRFGVLYTRHLGGHNIFHFMQGLPKDIAPDGYYACDTNGIRTGGNPCFMSDKMRTLFTSNVLDCARMAPENTDKIYINIQDTWKSCNCRRCIAPITLEDGTVIKTGDDAFRSTQYWMFMNKVTEALVTEFPKMRIVSLAYFPTAPAPKCRIHPKLHPEYAPYVRANDKRPICAPENLVWFKRLADWAAISNEIEIYEYYGLGLGFPRPLAEVRAWDFTFMNPFIVGMSSEYPARGDGDEKSAAAHWDASAMEYWVLTRLCWDPSQDVEKLRKYFIRRTFREAAPEIEKIYGTIREEWFKSNRASTLGDNAMELAKIFVLKPGHADAFDALFKAALARADLHPTSRVLAERLRDRLMKFVEDAKNLKNPQVSLPLLRPQGEVTFDSAVWNSAADLGPFIKMTKARDKPSDFRTEVKMFHDSDNIRMRVVCDDPNVSALPHVDVPSGRTKNDYIPEADHLEIFFCDPIEDGKYYMFSVTPDDIAADLVGYDGAWNGEWTRTVKKTATGWEVLLAFPLKTINANNDEGNDLKFLVLRQYDPHGERKGREYASWGGGVMHQTATFGDVKLMR